MFRIESRDGSTFWSIEATIFHFEKTIQIIGAIGRRHNLNHLTAFTFAAFSGYIHQTDRADTPGTPRMERLQQSIP